MKLHLFDTSALSDLAEAENALLRHRLIADVDSGRIVVLATHPLIWEIAGVRAANEPHYIGMMDLLFRVTRRRVLLRLQRRAEAEIRNGGPLAFPAYVDDEQRLELPLDVEEIDTAAATNVATAAGLTFREAERAEDTRQGLEDEARRQAREKGEPYDATAVRRGLKEAYERQEYVLDLIEHYARTDVDEVCSEVGLIVPSLHPRSFPSLWSRAVTHVARIRAVMVGGTRPAGRKSPGAIDLIHLKEAGAYADVFVTSDRRLRAFAANLYEKRCDVLSFEEWAATLAGP